MKFYIFSLSIFFIYLTFVSHIKSIKVIKIEKNPLKNPLRIFKLTQEKEIILRAKFMWEQPGKNKSFALNQFDYKILQISKDTITIFTVDQSLTTFTSENINASKFLMSIKVGNLDRPCIGNYMVCKLGGFIKEYKNRLKKLDFTINKQVVNEMSAFKAKEQCIILTIGLIESLSKAGYLCFDTKEEFIFNLDLISHKVIIKANDIYDGTITLINQNSNNVGCTKGIQPGVLVLDNNELLFHNGKLKNTKHYKEYFKTSYKYIYGYANNLYGMEKLPWKLDPKLKPNEQRCFKFIAKVYGKLSPIYFCVFKPRADWSMEQKDLNNTGSFFVADMWVANLNQKLHKYNLKVAQEITLRTVKTIDCNSHIMHPIKYQYRFRVSINHLIVLVSHTQV